MVDVRVQFAEYDLWTLEHQISHKKHEHLQNGQDKHFNLKCYGLNWIHFRKHLIDKTNGRRAIHCVEELCHFPYLTTFLVSRTFMCVQQIQKSITISSKTQIQLQNQPRFHGSKSNLHHTDKPLNLVKYNYYWLTSQIELLPNIHFKSFRFFIKNVFFSSNVWIQKAYWVNAKIQKYQKN